MDKPSEPATALESAAPGPSENGDSSSAPPPSPARSSSRFSLRWVAESGIDLARDTVDAVDRRVHGESEWPLVNIDLDTIERQVDRLPGGKWAKEQIQDKLPGATWLKDQLRDKLPDTVPGATWAKEQIQSLERDVIRVVRDHLDSVDPRILEATPVTIPTGTTSPAATGAVPPEAEGEPADPVDLLSQLLERGINQTADEAHRAVLVRAVRDLVPDEAKILASMVGGRMHPVINIDAASPLGTQRVLSYVTNGKLAGVRSSDLVLQYVTHLVDLGLVEVGPEDPAFDVDYQVLESGSEVRAAIERIEQRRLHKGRTERATLRLSELGQTLWDSETGTSDQPDEA